MFAIKVCYLNELSNKQYVLVLQGSVLQLEVLHVNISVKCSFHSLRVRYQFEKYQLLPSASGRRLPSCSPRESVSEMRDKISG